MNVYSYFFQALYTSARFADPDGCSSLAPYIRLSKEEAMKGSMVEFGCLF